MPDVTDGPEGARVGAPRYTPSEAELAAVVAQHELGQLTGWQRLEGGVVNPVLRLDLCGGAVPQAVLRVNVRNPELPKFLKEAWVLHFVREHLPAHSAWRVPAVLATDTSHALLPYDYIVLEMLPGVSGWDVWEATDASVRAALSRQLGAIVADLHALPLPGTRYGDWDPVRRCLGTHDDWRALVAESTEKNAAEIATLGLQRATRLDEARSWLDAHLEVIPSHPRRALAHHDCHFSNALVERSTDEPCGWRVTGVLDFEWCGAASPPAEFCTTMFWPGFDAAPFVEGYLRGGRFDRAFLQEAHYYEMQHHLEMICVCHKYWGGAQADEHTGRIEELLRGVPAQGFAAAGYEWPF